MRNFEVAKRFRNTTKRKGIRLWQLWGGPSEETDKLVYNLNNN